MMKWRYYIGLGMAAVLGWGMVACSDSVPSAAAEEKPVVEGKYYLNLTLRMADIAGSRAADPDLPSTPGADSENHISSLHVFFADDKGGEWKVLPLNVNLSGDDESEIRIPLEEGPLPEGITMYLGANLNEEQVKAFMEKNEPYSLKYDDTDYVNDLSPYSIGYDGDESKQTGIAMFCTKPVQPQKVEGKYNVYTVSFSLKRLVAKVLLTCEASEPGGEYAELVQKDSEKDKRFKGWIRLDDIWYIVNARNRSTYIMQELIDGAADADANVEDPNMNLVEYVNEAFKTGQTEESQYSTMVSANFSYISRDQYRKKPHFRKALRYEEERMGEKSSNPYTEGVYCPENTFVLADTELTSDLEDKLKTFGTAWGMITHVSIMAKFTPCILNVEYGLFDYIKNHTSQYFDDEKNAIEKLRPSDASNPSATDVFEIDCGTEAVAKAMLTGSLLYKAMLSPGTEEKFPEETYFYHTEADGSGAYYTYGAARIKYDSFDEESPKDLGNYVPHLTGWGYYYTYIDNRSEENKAKTGLFKFYKHGQVERNRYYILNIRSFSNPGASIVGSEYIEVNTKTKDWIPGGEGNITLD